MSKRFAEAALAAVLTTFVSGLMLVMVSGGAGPSATIGEFLLSSPAGVTAAVAAATGVPVDWSVGGAGGRLQPVLFLLDGSPLILLVAGPLAGSVLLVTRLRRRPGGAGALATAVLGYGGVLTAGAAIGGGSADAQVRLDVPLAVVALAAAGWALAAGVAAAALPPQSRRAGRRPATPSRAAAMVVVLLAGSAFVATPAAAAAPEPVQPLRGAVSAPPADHHRAGVQAALERLRAEQGGGEPLVAHEPWRGTPSMLSTRSPFDGYSPGWLRRHSGLFGIADAATQLRPVREQREPTGERHLWFEQHVDGVPVFGARVALHLDRTNRYVEFVTNGAEPDLVAPTTRARVSARTAEQAARLALPSGELVEQVRLYLLPAAADPGRPTRTVLTWLVWLADETAGLSNAYFVDAGTGHLVYALPMAAQARNRQIYDAVMNTKLPLFPVRREGDGPNSVQDVNEAYDHLGATYDYFLAVHGRDSYDGNGAPIHVYVRVRERSNEPLQNAMFVTGPDRMIFGEGMAKLDVAAHELAHGVTFNTAGLWYMYQSGALNESFSDMFAEAVENRHRGSNDWLLGKEIASGPFRSMAYPTLYGDPDDYRNFKSSCSDWGGVHTNSGIPNRAFYLLSQNIGIEKAGRIAYRTLTTYLGPRARFTDARVGFIESANKLFGKGSKEATDTAAAWAAVGVDGVFEQPRQECPCIADDSLSSTDGAAGMDPNGPGVDAVLAALLHVRDLFSGDRGPALRHYENAYAMFSPRATQLMAADTGLRRRTAHAVQSLEPALRTVGTPAGDSTPVTGAMLDELERLLRDYAAADRLAGGGLLADQIESEIDRAAFDQLVGLPVNRALADLDARIG
ncbi:M4 family metallopeptidase [Micromonospora zamorensis]|uniref:M4 family metallopeptidase n=1 Tax=Micromonospora zamorensis TaxID=709883 RepID=UPI0033B1D94B